MNKKVITFGEIMMRLTPQNNKRFIQANKFDIIYGGGEANVAVSLANYGLNPYFVSKLPINPLGQAALNELRRYGVKTDYITRGGNRLGIYFCENGASQRSSNVIYDRAHSSIATATKDDFNWNKIFTNAKWFHITGITPALSKDMAEISLQAVKKAKEYKVKVSCDLNYRSKLWNKKEANKIMSQIMEYVDICIANEEDAEMIFNIQSGSNIEKGEINIKGYKKVAKQLMEKFNLELVGSHLRISHSASVNNWMVVLYNGNEFVQSKKYKIHIVDRVGGGDSFAAALIYSRLTDKNLSETAEFGAASSALKHSIPGDFNHMNLSEVETLTEGSGAGRVKR